MINQEYLKSLLKYNPDTGFFNWIRARKRGTEDGCVAGSTDTHGHRQIRIDGRQYLAHRLAFLYMKGRLPKNEIDHINRDRKDNRWINLREATRQQNQFNTGASRVNKLGVKGVHLHGKSYQAYSRLNRKQHYLGSFPTIEEAKEAYDKFTKKNHGKFYKER